MIQDALQLTQDDTEIDPYTGKLKAVQLQQNSIVQTGINRNLLYLKSEVDAKVNAAIASISVPRVLTITSSATPSINTDVYDAISITAQAVAITSFTTNLSGSPVNFEKLTIRIKDDGTARAIAWGASFEAKGVALPTTTVISKVLTTGFIYDSVTSKWGCVASAQEA